MYISLGSACDCHYHIKRLQLKSFTVPFNSSFTIHKVLVDSIATGFSKIFKNMAIVKCHTTQFEWHHRNVESLTGEIWDIWNHQVDNFLSLKGKEDVVFMRKTLNQSPAKNEEEHQELLECLRSNGYKGKLIFGVYPQNNEESPFFTFRKPSDNEHLAWIGCNEEWDEFILRSHKYQV